MDRVMLQYACHVRLSSNRIVTYAGLQLKARDAVLVPVALSLSNQASSVPECVRIAAPTVLVWRCCRSMDSPKSV